MLYNSPPLILCYFLKCKNIFKLKLKWKNFNQSQLFMIGFQVYSVPTLVPLTSVHILPPKPLFVFYFCPSFFHHPPACFCDRQQVGIFYKTILPRLSLLTLKKRIFFTFLSFYLMKIFTLCFSSFYIHIMLFYIVLYAWHSLCAPLQLGCNQLTHFLMTAFHILRSYSVWFHST